MPRPLAQVAMVRRVSSRHGWCVPCFPTQPSGAEVLDTDGVLEWYASARHMMGTAARISLRGSNVEEMPDLP